MLTVMAELVPFSTALRERSRRAVENGTSSAMTVSIAETKAQLT